MLVLYSTLGCHLCEQALHIIRHECGLTCPISVVDIADDTGLMALYAIRIPVLKHEPSGAELGWPFAPEELLAWLTSCGHSD